MVAEQSVNWFWILLSIGIVSVSIVIGCILIALLETFTGVFTSMFKAGKNSV